MNGSTWRAWVVAAAIFVLGAAAGAAGMAVVGIRVFRHALMNPLAGRALADRAVGRIGGDLVRTLDLTPDEARQVRAILNETSASLQGVRAQAAAQTSAEIRAGVKKIAAVLPPDKRREFYRLIVRRYQRIGLPPPEPGAQP